MSYIQSIVCFAHKISTHVGCECNSDTLVTGVWSMLGPCPTAVDSLCWCVMASMPLLGLWCQLLGREGKEEYCHFSSTSSSSSICLTSSFCHVSHRYPSSAVVYQVCNQSVKIAIVTPILCLLFVDTSNNRVTISMHLLLSEREFIKTMIYGQVICQR